MSDYAHEQGRGHLSRREFVGTGAAVTGAALASPLLVGDALAGERPGPPPPKEGERVRIRDFGFPGVIPAGTPGELNAITDVPGVLVGHTTLIRGDSVRTGVTAIVPHPGNVFQQKVSGAVYIGNAFGKLAGSTQVVELGTIETPIILTNTLSVGRAVDAVVGWVVRQPGNENVGSVNALVGETNDGFLNDIRGRHVSEEDVVSAIETASGGPVEEGSVGAGTGTTNFGWKGGIGTSSRVLPQGTVGVLVQTNFGGSLTIGGVPVGRLLAESRSSQQRVASADSQGAEGGSCMIVVATDAPVSDRNLRRIAARAVFAMGKTGSSYSNGSGDFAIAFSTSTSSEVLSNDVMSGFFQQALNATEEAIYNALFMATTMDGRLGRVREALPLDEVHKIFRKYLRW
jgi:D-aminopeptidase